MARSPDIKTPLARVAFAQGLFKLQERSTGKKQYGCSLLFPKSEDLAELKKAAANAAVEAWGEKAKALVANGAIKSPFLDGDGPQGVSKKSGERHAGFAGHTFVRVIASEEYPPHVFDRKVQPVLSAAEFPSGCYAYAVVNAFTWENQENGKGISFGVTLLQYAKPGEALGGAGGPAASDYFTQIADEVPDAAKSDSGAAGLFG